MADEQQQWDELDALLRRELGRPARVDPAALGRVMAEVRAAHAAPRGAWASARAAAAWLFRPRPFAVSPFGALAATAAVVALVAVALRATARPGTVDVAATPPAAAVQNVAQRPGTQNVQFVFVNTEASSVSLVGDFNDWDLAATPLRRTGSEGIWSVVIPLPAGEHHYSYVVDGKTWVPDATAPQAPAGELGGTNSVLFVGGRS